MDTEFARQRMVQQQIRTWDVSDPAILDVIQQLNRDQFVPAEFAQLAYADIEIPLAHGHAMMKPNVEGRLLQALDISPSDSVLEIGTGSGYLTACLAGLAKRVCSIDIHADLLPPAESVLQDIGIRNVTFECMDVMADLPDEEFDVIAVTGSTPQIQTRFVQALKPGGRMFAVLGDSPIMSAELITRGNNDDWQSTSLFETKLEPLLNVEKTPVFLF